MVSVSAKISTDYGYDTDTVLYLYTHMLSIIVCDTTPHAFKISSVWSTAFNNKSGSSIPTFYFKLVILHVQGNQPSTDANRYKFIK